MRATSSVGGGERAPVLSDGGLADDDANVLVLPGDGPEGEQVIDIAAAIAGSGRLYVSAPGRDGSRSEGGSAGGETAVRSGTDTRAVPLDGPLTDEAVRSLAARYGISTLVADSDRFRRTTGTVDVDEGPDVVTVEVGERFETVSSVLVPAARGPHLEAILDVARTLAAHNDAWIELFHVVSRNGSGREQEAAEELFTACAEQLGSFDEYDTWTYEAADPASAIAEQSSYYDATVLGAPQKGRLREFVAGSTTGDVREEATNTVITVRNGDASSSRIERWIGAGT